MGGDLKEVAFPEFILTEMIFMHVLLCACGHPLPPPSNMAFNSTFEKIQLNSSQSQTILATTWEFGAK